MKSKFITFLVIGAMTSISYADDHVFFAADAKHFVRTEVLEPSKNVRFSGCEVAPNSNQAICSPIAIVNKDEFQAMRDCDENTRIGLASAGAVLFVAGAVLTAGGSVVIATVTVGTGLGLGASAGILTVTTEDGGKVFSESVEKNEDHITYGNIDGLGLGAGSNAYYAFIDELKETFEDALFSCDISDGVKILDNTKKESMTLTPEQVNLLKQASNIN